MALPILVTLAGCEKDVAEPEGCYTLSVKKEGVVVFLTEPYTVEAGLSISFENCGKADFYSFFPGTPGHVYSEYIDPEDTTTTGQDTNTSGDISVTYSNPGDYLATMLLTNREVGNPDNYTELVMNFTIKVTEPAEEK